MSMTVNSSEQFNWFVLSSFAMFSSVTALISSILSSAITPNTAAVICRVNMMSHTLHVLAFYAAMSPKIPQKPQKLSTETTMTETRENVAM